MNKIRFYAQLVVVFVSMSCISCDQLGDILGGSDDLSSIELPEYCDVNTIEGWTNVRFCKNGTVIFTKNYEGTPEVHKTLLLMPNDSLGLVSIYSELDENKFPKYVAFDDMVVFIDNYKENKLDATLIQGNQVLWTATDLELDLDSFLEESLTKSWSENNWVRNVAAVGGVVTSCIGIGVGVMLSGTGAGTIAGLATIGLSSKALADNLNVLFGPGESYAESHYVKEQFMGIGMNTLVDVAAKDKSSYINTLFKNSWFTEKYSTPNLFWAELIFGTADAVWGKTVTEADKRREFAWAHQTYSILTLTPNKLTATSVELSGYISPEAITPLNKYAEVEYGIVIYKADNQNDRSSREDIVCSGGNFTLSFVGLDPDTEYCYYVYYYDKTNGCYRQGDVKTFITAKEGLLKLDDISYGNYYYYVDDIGSGIVVYNVTATTSGSTPNDMKYVSAGIYEYDPDLGRYFILCDGLSGSFNKASVNFNVPVYCGTFTENVDYYRYSVETPYHYCAAYIVYEDGTVYESERIKFNYCYNKKPSLSFTRLTPINVSVLGTKEIEEGKEITEYAGTFGYTVSYDGVFWIDSIESVVEGGEWTFDGYVTSHMFYPNADGEASGNSTLRYWSIHDMNHAVSYYINTIKGNRLYACSLVIGGSPENPVISSKRSGTSLVSRKSVSESQNRATFTGLCPEISSEYHFAADTPTARMIEVTNLSGLSKQY